MEINMESLITESKSLERMSVRTSTSSNQLYIAESLDLPDDTFRISLDSVSVIGENVIVGDISTDTPTVNVGTPVLEINTPLQTPVEENPAENSPPIIETPKVDDSNKSSENIRQLNLLQLSLPKRNENDIFVKPSPVMEMMSPARMLQFEVDTATSATPTMKRAVIDFDFFSKNNFDEYFNDEPKVKDDEAPKDSSIDKSFEETTVIVQANTVRHEIGYGMYVFDYVSRYTLVSYEMVIKFNGH